MERKGWQRCGRVGLVVGAWLALMMSCLPITPTLLCRPCPCSEAHGYTCVGGLCVLNYELQKK